MPCKIDLSVFHWWLDEPLIPYFNLDFFEFLNFVSLGYVVFSVWLICLFFPVDNLFFYLFTCAIEGLFKLVLYIITFLLVIPYLKHINALWSLDLKLSSFSFIYTSWPCLLSYKAYCLDVPLVHDKNWIPSSHLCFA